MPKLTIISVIKSIELIADLFEPKFLFFTRNEKKNFEEKLKFVKELTQNDVKSLQVGRKILLKEILFSVVREIDSPYFRNISIITDSGLNDYLVEFQEQLKKVYIRYSESENRVLMHYSPVTTYSNDWNNFTRVARGIVVDLDDYSVVVHPYDKFFNYLEKPETQPHSLPYTSYEVAEKLDGSEGILYPAKDGTLRVITKGGFDTEQGRFATELLNKKYARQVRDISNHQLWRNYTIIFEILYAKDDPNRIVVAYDEPDLKIIGVRNLKTGKTLSYKEVQAFAQVVAFPSMKTYEHTLEELMELRKDAENFEGWVLRFENELYMKIKCEPYLDAHGARFGTSLKAVFNLIKEEKWDDFIAGISEENRPTPEALHKRLTSWATHYSKKILDTYNSLPKIENQKEFAFYVRENVENGLQGYMFELRQGRDIKVFTTWTRVRDAVNEYEQEKASL